MGTASGKGGALGGGGSGRGSAAYCMVEGGTCSAGVQRPPSDAPSTKPTRAGGSAERDGDTTRSQGARPPAKRKRVQAASDRAGVQHPRVFGPPDS